MAASLLAAASVGLSVQSSRAEAQSISTSQLHTCAVSEAGDAYCWGRVGWITDAAGQHDVPFDASPMPHVPHAPGMSFVSMATGYQHDCVLVRTGQVFCSGVSYVHGELGRDTTRICKAGMATCVPADSVDTPERFKSVVAGLYHVCALTRDGRAFCWGANESGQAGVGTRNAAVLTPTPVVGNYRFTALTAGLRHTCGITVGGETLCWGANGQQQLGFNMARRGCSFSDLCTAAPSPLDQPQRYVVLKAGGNKTCGVTATGSLYCWGDGYTPVGNQVPVTPVRIGASFAFYDVSPGGLFTCGIATGGRAYCWKEQSRAPIGQGLVTWGCTQSTTCIDETPVNDDLRFRAIASGDQHACGIAGDGAVYCWGMKNEARAGDALAQATCAGTRADLNRECSPVPARIGGDLNLLKPAPRPASTKKPPQ